MGDDRPISETAVAADELATKVCVVSARARCKAYACEEQMTSEVSGADAFSGSCLCDYALYFFQVRKRVSEKYIRQDELCFGKGCEDRKGRGCGWHVLTNEDVHLDDNAARLVL